MTPPRAPGRCVAWISATDEAAERAGTPPRKVWKHIFRPRTVAYTLIWGAIGLGLLVALFIRSDIDVSVAQSRNPVSVVLSDGSVVSGGNFHAEPVAFAADIIALALAEIGAIAQRRVALMVDPTLSHDLPPFLTPDPGLNSGYMIAEVTTAALMSENKHLANPCSTDSTPTSANQEDHVSMAAHGARRLARMNANLSVILGVEALCAAQGVDFRAPLTTSAPLQAAIAALRAQVPALAEDRFLAGDIAVASDLVRNGALIAAAGLEFAL